MKIQGVDNSYIPLQQEAKVKVFPERPGAALLEVDARSVGQAEKKVKDDVEQHKLEEAVEQANKTMETYNTELRFSIHKASEEVMVKVINTKDNSVIREIPPERVLDMVAYVKKMLGIIIDKFI
ncbi:MAG: flagellar protein FlaG [Pelotomaculum sp. PtaU1.Bin035]|nr:MAG: flagellar protein FlaG [Pelotomaculum sp. PtaU1.Bin035]